MEGSYVQSDGRFHIKMLFFHVVVVNSLSAFSSKFCINTENSPLVILLLTVSAAFPVVVASPACLSVDEPNNCSII